MIFVDSNVLIDLIESNSQWGDWSENQLALGRVTEGLVINAIVYAEISRTFATQRRLDDFLSDVEVKCVSIPNAAAFAASTAHRTYRSSGGARTTTLPDFFIGAHAQVENFSLLTRGAARIRSYFPQVTLIAPE